MRPLSSGRFFFLLWLMLAGISSAGQNYFFTGYTIESGLSQSVVNCIHQDAKGFIWIGTQNGLNRFDGYRFLTYNSKPSDTNTLSNNWIYSISEDKNGDLWIGTKGGLNKFIMKEKRFHRLNWVNGYSANLTDHVYDVLVTQSGKIVVNTPPVLTILDPQTGKFSHHLSDLPFDGAVKDTRIPLLEDTEGNIWIGSTRGLACFHPSTGRFTYYTHKKNDPASLCDDNITALFTENNGRLWVGTSGGVNFIDTKKSIVRRITAEEKRNQAEEGMFVRAITGDREGCIWIGTDGGGLYRFIPHGGALDFRREIFTSEHHGLTHNIVLSLMTDRSENLWIGTLQGLSKTDLKPRKFNLYRTTGTNTPVDLLGNVIASIYKDVDGKIWIGNWGQGLNIVDRKTGQAEHFSSRFTGKYYIPNDYVHYVFPDESRNVWIGTRDGIFVYDRGKEQFVKLSKFFGSTAIPDFSGMRIYKIIRSRNGSYWVATQNGLFRFDLKKNETEYFNVQSPPDHRLSANLVYSVMEDREGLIWIGTLGGLDLHDPVKKTLTHFYKEPGNSNSLSDNFVTTLYQDHLGNIWIGTNSYLNKFNKNDTSFTCYSQEQGIPSNLIYEILEDDIGNMWISTGGGLCRLDGKTGKCRTFTVEEGLQSTEFNLRACYKCSDGEMFFGGMNGFNSFYPGQIKDNPHRPEIVFTSCYKITPTEKIFQDVESVDPVEFKYNDYNFTVEFAALEFTNPEKNRYAYKLQGVSNEWVDIGNRKFVTFSNLSSGTYYLKIKGSNNDGLWNEGPTLKIIIHPPWWRTIWALIVYVLLIAGGILIFVYLRERKLIREKDELEQKVHMRTLQIEVQNTEILQKNEELNNLNMELKNLVATRDKFFSIIAHDLRNPFHTILGLSEIILGNIGKDEPEKIRKSVTDIRDSAKHTFDLLQNLLMWARSQTGVLDFQPISFDLSERIRENIDLVKSQAEKKYITVACDNPSPKMINADMRMVDTILRNLLTNAVKFTEQHGKVTVSAVENDDHFEVSVTDSGIGMTPEIAGKIFRSESNPSRRGTEKEKGSGLGLMLCREFVEKHRGTIKVISEPGKGSSFIFTLPK